jgi:hypothetical protein
MNLRRVPFHQRAGDLQQDPLGVWPVTGALRMTANSKDAWRDPTTTTTPNRTI